MAVMSKQNLFSIVSDVRRMQDASVRVSLLLYRKEIKMCSISIIIKIILYF